MVDLLNLSPNQQAALCRASCAFFAQTMIGFREDSKDRRVFQVARHHQEWDSMVQAHDRVCVLAPRDHSKTYFFDFALPLWKAWHHPGGRGYIFSATQDQAVRILSDIKDEIEDNPKFAHLMPKRKEMWNATSVRLENGHRIYARGYGSKTRGAHPNWIVVDDGLNDEDATSEGVRNKHIEYFFTAITNMIVPGGQIVVVGTPFSEQDLYGKLKETASYAFKKFPAIREDGTPLWPERYSLAALEARRAEIGTVRFTREFLCEPIANDMSLFPSSLFEGVPTQQLGVRLGMALPNWRSLGIKSVYMGVDLAISASTGSDYTVIMVLGLDGYGNRWVMDIIRVKGMPFNKQLVLINNAARKYDADLIFIESNQMQRVFGDELIRTTDLPIKKFVTTGTGKANKGMPKGNTTSSNKNSLEGGVPSLRVLFDNQKFRIPRGDKHSVAMTDLWMDEMRSFAWLDGKWQGVGAHDDTVLATWIADQAVRAGGFSFSTGAEDDPAAQAAFLRELNGVDAPEKKEAEPEEERGADAKAALMFGTDEAGVGERWADGVSSAWNALSGLRR